MYLLSLCGLSSWPVEGWLALARSHSTRHFLSRAGRSSFCDAVEAARHDGWAWWAQDILLLKREGVTPRMGNCRPIALAYVDNMVKAFFSSSVACRLKPSASFMKEAKEEVVFV